MAVVGLLGGTFDPVHNGHLQLGSLVLNRYRIKTILFIPAAHPPHKDEHRVCDIDHRLNMLRLATNIDERFAVSEIETARTSVSYTIDTIDELRKLSDADTLYYFILGFDALSEIETWHRWQDLLYTINFIVAVRPGFSIKEVERLLARNGFYPDQTTKDRWVCDRSGTEVLFLREETEDISSTAIRKRIAEGALWRSQVPPEVAEYITRNNLYIR
jgi:nicotinate-nucleotide adenylyltransferase